MSLLLTCCPILLMAQQFQISPDVLAASGGEGTYQSYEVNWTLGETVIGGGAYSNGDRQVTNGFNQGFYCQWFGMDTIWTPVTSEEGDTLWWENTGVEGPNPHFYESSWCYVSVPERGSPIVWDAQLFPNPTDGELNIRLSGMAGGTEATGHLFNTLGQQAGQWPLGEGTTRIQAGHLPAGMYLMHITSTDGRSVIKRVIRQ
jgi:hypothetical protein